MPEAEGGPNALLITVLICVCALGLSGFAIGIHTFLARRAPRMWFYCTACGKVFESSFQDTFPVKCELCKRASARFARRCGGCGKVFGTNGWWGRTPCPHCKGWQKIERYEGN